MLATKKYKISLALSSGEEYKSEGKTIHEALDALELNYTQIKTKGTLTLQCGDRKASKFFYCRPLRRVVVNKLRKAQVGRDLEYLLK